MISERDQMRLAVEAYASLRTVKRFLAGESVHENTKHRLEQAAKKLRLELPREGE